MLGFYQYIMVCKVYDRKKSSFDVVPAYQTSKNMNSALLFSCTETGSSTPIGVVPGGGTGDHDPYLVRKGGPSVGEIFSFFFQFRRLLVLILRRA